MIKDKSGNIKSIPDAKCPKCGTGCFHRRGCIFPELGSFICKNCHWTWYINEENNGFYFTKTYKKVNNGAVPISEGDHKWKWMPLTKNKINKK